MPLNQTKEQKFSRTKEQRICNVELRAEKEESRTIGGYIAKFDKKADIYGMFSESIRKNAFKKTIQEADIRCLFNHDPNYPLGRNKSGTLRLEEDDIGLKFENDLPDTNIGNDLYKSIQRGDISQCSFGFTPIKEEWRDGEQGLERELLEVKLFDVSPVTFPAYVDTEVSARNAVSNKLGFPVEMFSAFLTRSSKEDVTEDEKELIKKMKNKLDDFIDEPDDSHSSHHRAEESPDDEIENLFREFELLKLEE